MKGSFWDCLFLGAIYTGQAVNMKKENFQKPKV